VFINITSFLSPVLPKALQRKSLSGLGYWRDQLAAFLMAEELVQVRPQAKPTIATFSNLLQFILTHVN